MSKRRWKVSKPCQTVCMQSCVVVFKVRSMVDVAAVIVTAWFLDAHVFGSSLGRC